MMATLSVELQLLDADSERTREIMRDGFCLMLTVLLKREE